jgi:hypothetical protein
MEQEPTHTPGGDDRTRDQSAPEPARRDAERSVEESDAARGVPRETYEKVVDKAVKDVHG